MSRALHWGLVLLLCVATTTARGADDAAAIERGLNWLRGQAGGSGTGESALLALALIKAEVSASDAALAACINRIKSRFNGSFYNPDRRGGADIYEAAVVAMALANYDPVAYKGEINAAAQYLIANQRANGSWDYSQPMRLQGDTSISQYAVLGLWEAANAGAVVPARVWDKAASWYLSVQSPQGSWNYHRDEAGMYPETVSMTAAGVGSLLICQRQLRLSRRASEGSSLLVPLVAPEGGLAPVGEAAVTAGRVNGGIQRGLRWLGSNFSTAPTGVIGQSLYYGLYGIERIGALADRETIGRTNWFDDGCRAILASQQADGRWVAQHGEVPNTAWAILFLTKSTAQTLKKIEIKRLGAGNLRGGKGLPKDLSTLTVSASGRVLVRPMNGAIDAMLDVLADPRADKADSALAGLVQRYHAQGPKALRPYKDRFRKLLSDPDPDVRMVAAWALGRTADLDVVPALIGALRDVDEGVVQEARTGLQVISRKMEGHGPPPGSTPEQRQEAAQRWRAWFDSVRPPDHRGPEGDLDAPPAP